MIRTAVVVVLSRISASAAIAQVESGIYRIKRMAISECGEERDAAVKTLLDLRGDPLVVALFQLPAVLTDAAV